MKDDLERSLLDAGRVEPGADVRARVLAATVPLVRRDDSRLDRVWFSPRWRVAAVLMLVLLPGIDVVSTRLFVSMPVAEVRASAAGTVQAVEVAAREAGLPPDERAALVAQAIAAARAATMRAPGADMSVGGSNQ